MPSENFKGVTTEDLKQSKMKDEVVPILDETSSPHVCMKCRGRDAAQELGKKFLKPWFVLGCSIIIFTFFCIIVGLTIYLMTNVVKYPGLLVTGTLKGNVSTSLGNLGNITLHPEVDVNLKVAF